MVGDLEGRSDQAVRKRGRLGVNWEKGHTLFCNVKALRAIGVIISAPEEFSEHWVIAGGDATAGQ